MPMRLRTFAVTAAVAGALGTGVVLMARGESRGPAAAQDAKKPATCTLQITGMTCAGCEAAVKMAAKKVDGVSGVDVSYKTGRAEVTYDPAKTTPEKIAQAITRGSGFKARVDTSATQPSS